MATWASNTLAVSLLTFTLILPIVSFLKLKSSIVISAVNVAVLERFFTSTFPFILPPASNVSFCMALVMVSILKSLKLTSSGAFGASDCDWIFIELPSLLNSKLEA
ncbi:hypothetical protein D3C86_1000070 [compost metagenome]